MLWDIYTTFGGFLFNTERPDVALAWSVWGFDVRELVLARVPKGSGK
jgi:hypothetical protein